MNQPRVVLVHRYFHPDTPPYASILRSVAEALATSGMQVTVLTCQPSYNRAVISSAPASESLNGVDIVRWKVINDRTSSRAKAFNLVLFALRLILARRYFRGADVVMAATTPPVFIALVCSWLATLNGAKFIYHKQDIWPEVVQAKSTGPPSLVHRLLKRIDARTDRRAARVVVLSGDMKSTEIARGVNPSSLTILNNFDPWNLASLTSPAEPASTRDLTLVFAGSLGRFQGLDRLMGTIRATKEDRDIKWHFFGDGPVKQELDALVAEGCNVVLHGYRPADDVASFVARADLGIVSLHPGVIEAAYPSKTMTYLRQGCPLLALVDADSELAATVRDHAIGVTVAPAESNRLADQLRALVVDRTPLEGARERALELYEAQFAATRQLSRWTEMFEEVASL